MVRSNYTVIILHSAASWIRFCIIVS